MPYEPPTTPPPDSIPCACSGQAVIVGGEKLYPHRPDLYEKKFYLCDCGRYVGTHASSGHPLGTPADAETRAARGRAHAAFDPLWKDKHFETRGAAYRWLAAAMGVTEEVHIAQMDAKQADQVASLCNQYPTPNKRTE
jgi:hypothetical protein